MLMNYSGVWRLDRQLVPTISIKMKINPASKPLTTIGEVGALGLMVVPSSWIRILGEV